MPEQERAVLDTLAEPSQSPALLLVALLLSAVLGGLHGSVIAIGLVALAAGELLVPGCSSQRCG
jgi:hypothetical protein